MISKKLEEQKQHSRNKCDLIHNVPENNGKLTDELAVEIFRDNLEVEVTLRDISRSHRMGKPRN